MPYSLFTITDPDSDGDGGAGSGILSKYPFVMKDGNPDYGEVYFAGEIIDVDVDTHVVGMLRFESGAIVNLVTTFDVYARRDSIELYGTKGTLYVPDPNNFGGPVKLYRPEGDATQEIPLMFNYSGNSRALGLADMAKAITDGRPYRACSEQTFHVLEVMEALLRSGKERREIKIESPYERKAPMVTAAVPGVLD